MSSTLDHIVRHDFHDLADKDAAAAFMKSKIAQLRSCLRIKDEIIPSIVDYSESDKEGSSEPAPIDYSFHIPNYDAHVQMARGYWIISQALSMNQLFTRYNGEYDLRRDIFDIARALGQNEAWHCSCYCASMGEIDYFEEDFDTWIKHTLKHETIREFDEEAIDTFRRQHPNEYFGQVIHDSFKDCRENMDRLQKRYPDYHICHLGRVAAKYLKAYNDDGCFLMDQDTGNLLLDYPIDDVLENICGAGMIIQKDGLSALFSLEGRQMSDFVAGVWRWKWSKGDSSGRVIVYNERENLSFEIS